MRFTVRSGSDPVARADAILLKALGMPAGGAVKVGKTHVLIKGGDMTEPTAIRLGPIAMGNAGVAEGQSVEVERAVLPPAGLVVIAADQLPAEPRDLVRAMQGRPVSSGDRIVVDGAYLGREEPVTLAIDRVEPRGAGLIGPATRFAPAGSPEAVEPIPDGGATQGVTTSEAPPVIATPPRGPSTSEALLAGLDSELDLLSGWLSLLTSPRDLPAAWGLPKVAGILLDGPHGCGKAELVAAAATNAGTRVHEVDVDLVFKPDRLLEMLEKAVNGQATPVVIFVDRIEAVAGDEALSPFRTQVAAIMRWFLDAVADKPGMACVIGVASRKSLDEAITASPLLPRSIAIPPPDHTRRKLLFEAALARVPNDGIDFDRLANRSAGFSGADVLAAVVHASSRVARNEAKLTTDDLVTAVEETQPSLGSMSLGEMPSYGFEKVANLVDVKQRLTEAVIWPVSDPDRFKAMGVEPPRGVLLYGPPGTGKTFVVRALAHEAGAAFFSVKGAELLDKYVGESERAVREVFGRARGTAPSIIFFDEFDALAPVRGRSTNSVTDSVVAALLTEIDGVGARGDVSVIAATNRRDLIDPALLRAGRFEIQVELGLPEKESRMALLQISDVPFGEDVQLDRLAEITDGMSFADITGVLREAALDALRADRNATTVAWSQIKGAVGRWQHTRGSDPEPTF